MTQITKSPFIPESFERWWLQLHADDATLKAKELKPFPTSYRAELKRCRTPDAVVHTEAFRALWFSLPEDLRQKQSYLRWAVIAGVMAHVRIAKKATDKVKSFAGGLGEHKSMKDGGSALADKPLVSTLRFKQLCQSRSIEAFYTRMIRTIQLIKGETFPKDLAAGMLLWQQDFDRQTDLTQSKPVVLQWAIDYYWQFPKQDKTKN